MQFDLLEEQGLVSEQKCTPLKETFVNEIKNGTISCSNSCKMDTKIKIKEEVPFSDDVDSQNETEFVFEDVKMKINSDDVLLGNGCDTAIKTELKSETVFPDIYSQNQNEFLLEDRAIKVEKHSSNHETYNKMKVNEELYLKTETSSISDDIKDEDFSPMKSPRLCKEATSGDGNDKSPLHSAEESRKRIALYNEKDHPECVSQESNVVEVEHVPSKQSSDRHELNSRTLYVGQHTNSRSPKCEICKKEFNRLGSLNRHYITHMVKKRYNCNLCRKSFAYLSSLKEHKLRHEGKKPYKCDFCEWSFVLSSGLKKHNRIHEGKKILKCEHCEKKFTESAHFEKHNLIHKFNKIFKCEICNKSFTQLSTFQTHMFNHEDRKHFKCKMCKKQFTYLSVLLRHELDHSRVEVV